MKTLPLSFAYLLSGASRSQLQSLEKKTHQISDTVSFDARNLGEELRMVEGLLWITQEGDPTDYLVGPGESFVVTRPGRVVVQSLTPESRFVFEETRA